jgi:uncharacterized protein
MCRYIAALSLLTLVWVSFGQVEAREPRISSEAVKFTSVGATLAGTIFRPEHPYAAVVIVQGAGQEKRMSRFAQGLARRGIAALTYDKRGVGESGGVYAGPEVGTNSIDAANLALLASDASAAVSTLSARLRPTHYVPIGLLGFSQAGWIIPLAAKTNGTVTFMVLFSGPVVTTHEQLRFQFYTQGNPNFWNTHTEVEAREHIRQDRDLYQFVDTDPREALAELPIQERGLWLFGGKDVEVPVGLSIERLDKLRAQGKAFEYRIFPTLGHHLAPSGPNGPFPFVVAVQWIQSVAIWMKTRFPTSVRESSPAH